MKLSLTLHDKIYSVESTSLSDDCDVYELAEQFKGLLVNAGYHPNNVDAIFNLDSQWFFEEDKSACCCSRALEIESQNAALAKGEKDL